MSFNALFHGFIRHLFYSKVAVRGGQHVPSSGSGPLLVLCLHRNGAVDAFVCRAAVRRLTFIIRAKLRNNPLGKIFFSGIEVVRSDDGGKAKDTLKMIETCASHLHGDHPLAIFPEGTSKLGPRHLPFKSGAARIALRFLEEGKPLTVIPLGIHYECPWAFRSRVEVVIGEPISLEPNSSTVSRGAVLRGIKQQFTTALESVGLNVPDEETYDRVNQFAYMATLGSKHHYFDALKSMEDGLPSEAVAAWEQLEDKLRDRWVLRHQGVPLFPTGRTSVYAMFALLLALPVLVGGLLNLLPLALGFLAARLFADDTNVIALWRILIGVPVFVLWAAAVVILSPAYGQGGAAIGYLALTSFAILGWYRLKKLAVASWNGLFQSDLHPEALALHKLMLHHLSSPEQTQ